MVKFHIITKLLFIPTIIWTKMLSMTAANKHRHHYPRPSVHPSHGHLSRRCPNHNWNRYSPGIWSWAINAKFPQYRQNSHTGKGHRISALLTNVVKLSAILIAKNSDHSAIISAIIRNEVFSTKDHLIYDTE